jgi:hypothetical protein
MRRFDVMEKAVEQHYSHTVILPEDIKVKLREAVQAALMNNSLSLTRYATSSPGNLRNWTAKKTTSLT